MVWLTDRPRVVAIVGTSYSGSTLANLILGSHPDIYAGGELSTLVLQRNTDAAACSSCGRECIHWTADARASASEESIYQLSQQIFGKNIIVDSSKSVRWTSNVLSKPGNALFEPVFVLMIKHPIRYLASCFVNIETPKGPYKSLVDRISRSYKKKSILDRWLDDLDRFYSEFFTSLPREIGGAPLHLLHYERLIENPSGALAPILASLGLRFVPSMERYSENEFHQIAGNAGAIFQLNRRWVPDNKEMASFRRSFYETGPRLKIDDKFKHVFSTREMRELLRHRIVQKLIENLGYNNTAMPFPVEPSIRLG
jgi:hypothetical protein